MSATILVMPSSSQDSVQCQNCGYVAETPFETLSYPHGNCPECGSPWTGGEKRSTMIQVTAPENLSGGAG
jgi:predicted Zn-ribbon and HTH transcriptional regulator